MNLAVLGIFKYFNFFLSTAVTLANTLGLRLDQPTLAIILPVGVVVSICSLRLTNAMPSALNVSKARSR